ncbi:MAG: type II secretion system protein GspL, partial [Acidiferrobacterales bacterium]
TLITEAEIPTRNRSKINKALPFVLEEQLLHNPEQEHFICHVRSGLPLVVTVTSKIKLAQWQDIFHEYGIYPSAMYPQVIGQTLENNSWSMTLLEGELLVKTSNFSGFSCQMDGNKIPLQLTSTLNSLNDNTKPEKIIFNEIDADLDIKEWSDETGIEIIKTKSDLWSTFQTQVPALNLLQGDFKPRREINPALSRFIPAAAIALIWITFSLIVNIWEWQTLNSSFKNANLQMIQLFKTSFPDAKTIVDPALQMQRKLENLSGSSGGYLESDFIALLSLSAPALAALENGAVESLRYNEKSLNISLGLPNFKTLEELKGRLAAIGMQVEVVAANSRADGIEGRLKITSK